MIFDTHSHFYGETLFRHMQARDAVPRVVAEGRRRFMVTPTSRFELSGGFVAIQDRLDWMVQQHIDRQMITFPGALGPDVLPIGDSLHLVRDVNDELSATAAAEIVRAVRGLGLAGAIIPSNYFHSLAGIAALEPLFVAADAVGAHLMLHPGQRHDESLDPRIWPDLTMHRASSIELHGGITHALVSLLHSDVRARFPHITWQVVNLGGTFPFLVERMDHIVATRDPSAPRPSELVGDVVFDCASLGPRALELAVAVFGAGRVMFGTDYPIFTSDVSTRALSEARLTQTQRDQVASGTALALLARNAQRRAGR